MPPLVGGVSGHRGPSLDDDGDDDDGNDNDDGGCPNWARCMKEAAWPPLSPMRPELSSEAPRPRRWQRGRGAWCISVGIARTTTMAGA